MIAVPRRLEREGEAVTADRRLLTRIVLRNCRSIAACDVSPARLCFLVGPNH